MVSADEGAAMETEVGQNKRRMDDQEDAVSEKIRRKSSVRTKRYQMVLSGMTSPSASEASLPESGDEPVSTAEDQGFSSSVQMESLQSQEQENQVSTSIPDKTHSDSGSMASTLRREKSIVTSSSSRSQASTNSTGSNRNCFDERKWNCDDDCS